MRALMLCFAARGASALRPALRTTTRTLVARRAAYDVAQVEEKWQRFWDDDKTFKDLDKYIVMMYLVRNFWQNLSSKFHYLSIHYFLNF